MRTTRITAALLALVTSAASQSAPYVTTVPRPFAGNYANGGSILPFARSGGFMQIWWRGDNFSPGQVLTAVGGRADKGLTTPTQNLAKVEITFANVSYGFSGLSSWFLSNLSLSNTKVFTAKPVSLPTMRTASNPDAPILWLYCDAPFVVLGPHVLGQFDLGPATNAVTLTHYVDAYSTNSASVTSNNSVGVSCGGTLANNSTSNILYDLRLTGADPFKAATLLLGSSHTVMGTTPLPLKLDAVGLTGCWLGVAPLLTVSGMADASGNFKMSVPIYTPITDSVLLFAQALHQRSANPSGWATTNVARSIIGGAGLANYVYNWSKDSAVAEYGPYTTNKSPVLMFKP